MQALRERELCNCRCGGIECVPGVGYRHLSPTSMTLRCSAPDEGRKHMVKVRTTSCGSVSDENIVGPQMPECPAGGPEVHVITLH